MSIYVTKPFMPSYDEYAEILKTIWERGILTNQGPCVQELERQLKEYLDVKHLHYLQNGTIALQLALSCLDSRDGEIITTPFSYVATTSSILWEHCRPVYVDIEADNFTINPDLIEQAITPRTKAIMAVHVFGYACDVEAIERIAAKHDLKVIYDAAHAFGTRYKGKSLLDYGDISTLSFHATKLFHTIEGGACVVRDKAISEKLDLQKRFGHNADEHIMLGINAKQSEFHAAMGLVNLPHMERILDERKAICELYDSLLDACVGRPSPQQELEYNYAYYPVVFKDEAELLAVFAALNEQAIFPRRYFYPSLNRLPYVSEQACPVSENLASRIACLPLYVGLGQDMIETITATIKDITTH